MLLITEQQGLSEMRDARKAGKQVEMPESQ